MNAVGTNTADRTSAIAITATPTSSMVMCAASRGRLLGFGVLALQRPETCATELKRLAGHAHMRGVTVGSAGRGRATPRSPAASPS